MEYFVYLHYVLHILTLQSTLFPQTLLHVFTDFDQYIMIRNITKFCNCLPELMKISGFDSICLQESPRG